METGFIIQYERMLGCTIADLATELRSIVEIAVQDCDILFRIKDEATLKKKMAIKGRNNIEAVDDIYGLRILVNSEKDAYAVLKRIEDTIPGYLDHDYISVPKINQNRPGKKLRLIQYIGKKNGLSFEVQITTKSFNEENEALHAEYHRMKYE